MALEAGSRGAERFDKVGADPPTGLPGRRVSNGFGRDGVHLLLGGYAWVRPCRLGTKPVVRIYTEADAPRGLARILAPASALLREGGAPGGLSR